MKKRVLSLLMALALCFTMLPAAAFAETVDAAAAEVQTDGKTADAHLAKEYATKDGGALQAAQTLIDTLPEDVTAENAAKIEAQLLAIDEAMDALTAEEAGALDMERYLSVCAALAAMTEVQAGEHSHKLCSHGGNCTICPSEATNSQTFATALTMGTDGVYAGGEKVSNNMGDVTLTAGTYYLAQDIGVNKIDINGDVVFCLNGSNITIGSNLLYGIFVNDGTTLTLCDCRGGGRITHHSSYSGGGVSVCSGGKLIMYGGSISGNATSSYRPVNGGGVCVEAGGSFTMYGGTISGNTATGKGGGVYVDSGGSFTVSGNVNISGNTGGNVYLPSGKTITLAGGLGDSASIGVTTETPPAAGNPVTIAQGGNGYAPTDADAGKFHDDTGAGNEIVLSSGAIVMQMSKPHEPHPICGASCGHTNDTHGNIDDWKGVSDLAEITGAGNYYLTKDVELTTNSWEPANNVVLCLNGHSITATALNAIEISSGCSFTLTDCKGGKAEYGKITTNFNGHGVSVTNGSFTMYGGNIAGNGGKTSTSTTQRHGAGVYVNENMTFAMHGGVISGNDTNGFDGGGVYVASGSTFTMTGGTISGNTAANGGGVYVKGGTFNMSGGKVAGNTASGDGGGVRLDKGTFNMSGSAVISRNTADGYGGGVDVNNGTFNMSGGSIIGNNAAGDGPNWSGGGGVNVYDGGKFTMSGGSITGNNTTGYGGGVELSGTGTMTVSGSVQITDNWQNGTLDSTNGLYVQGSRGKANNLYLFTDKTVAIGTAGLDADARIGVSTDDWPDSGRPVKIVTNATNEESHYTAIFTPDAEEADYKITKKNDNALYLSAHEHSWTYASDGKNTITATCTAAGCYNTNGGSVTINNPAHETYGDDKDANATLEKKLNDSIPVPTITYKKGNETLSAAPTNAGTYIASITMGEVTASVKYTINKATLTADDFTYAAPTDLIYNGQTRWPDITPRVDGIDDYYWSYYDKNDNMASGGLNVGTYQLHIKVTETENYQSADDLTDPTWTFTVLQREVTLTWDGYENRTYNDGGAVTATAGNLVNGDKIGVTVTGGNETVTGPHTATATGLTGDKADNYKLPANVTKEYTIGLAGQTLTFAKTDDQSVTYGDTLANPATNNRANSDGSEVTYTSSDENIATVDENGTVTAKNVGTTTITATAAEVTGRYSSATASYTLTVTKRPISLTLDPVTYYYGEPGVSFTSSLRIVDGTLAKGDTLGALKPSWSGGDTSKVGTFDVDVFLWLNSNYDVTFNGTQKLTVNPRPITVTVDAATRTYGEANPTFTAQKTGGMDFVGSDTMESLGLSLTTDASATSSVGKYDVTGTASNGNYAVTVAGTDALTVTAKAITVTVTPVTRAYGEANPVFTASAPSGALVGDDDIASLNLSLSSDATTTSNVGRYDVTGSANNANYIVTVEGTNALTVTAKPITVTAEDKSSRVGYNLVELTYTYTPALIGTDAFTGALTTNANKDVVGDQYTITQGSLALSANYAITFNTGKYTVTSKLTQSGFAFADSTITKTYGDPDFTVAASGAAEGSTVTYESSKTDVATVNTQTGRVTIVGAGTATIKAKASETKDYAEKEISYTLTVKPKPLTEDDLTYSGPITKVYDGSDSAPSGLAVSVKPASLVNGDILTVKGTLKFNSADVNEASEITFTPEAITTGNYTLAATEVLTIHSASITAKEVTLTSGINATDRQYEKDNKTVVLTKGAVSLTGLVDNETLDVNIPATGSISDAKVGTYNVTYSGVTLADGIGKASNYTLNAALPTITVTISKAAAPVLADIPVSFKYTVTTGEKAIGDADVPADAGALTYAKGTESKTGSVTVVSWDVDSTGKVAYTLSGGKAGDSVTLPVTISSANYEDAVVKVVITLIARDDQAELRITGGTTVVYGQKLALGTSGGSGTGTVTYTVTTVTNGTGEATIDPVTGVLTPVKVGSVTVTATKAGDVNYNEAASAPVEITITKATPAGEPKYTKINGRGKTLADAALSLLGGTLNLTSGTLEWVDENGNVLSDTTTVAANKVYTWRFTPTDGNYTVLTGSVVLYAVSSSGGGFRPAHSNRGDRHTITAIAGANGAISPSGDNAIRTGGQQTFTITPDEGYAVAKVLIDGKSVGAVTSYTFQDVTEAHTIRVIFMKANGNPQTGVSADTPARAAAGGR